MTRKELDNLSYHLAEMLFSHKSERAVVLQGECILRDFPKVESSQEFKNYKHVIFVSNIQEVLKSWLWGRVDEMKFNGIPEELLNIFSGLEDDDDEDYFYDVMDDYLTRMDWSAETVSDKVGFYYGIELGVYIRENFLHNSVWVEMVEEKFLDRGDIIDFLTGRMEPLDGR